MKKFILLFLILTLSLTTGCSDIEDLADISIEATEIEAFPVGAVATDLIDIPPEYATDFPVGYVGVSVDLSGNSDYDDYKDYIKSIEISRFEYKVAQNIGSAGSFTLYVAPYDSTVPTDDITVVTDLPTGAREILSITFEAGTTTEDWINSPISEQAFFSDLLLNDRKFTLWAKAETDGLLFPFFSVAEIVAKISIKITANPLEGL